MTKKANVVFYYRKDYPTGETNKDTVCYLALGRETKHVNAYAGERTVFTKGYRSDQYPRCTGGPNESDWNRLNTFCSRIMERDPRVEKYYDPIGVVPIEYFV